MLQKSQKRQALLHTDETTLPIKGRNPSLGRVLNYGEPSNSVNAIRYIDKYKDICLLPNTENRRLLRINYASELNI